MKEIYYIETMATVERIDWKRIELNVINDELEFFESRELAEEFVDALKPWSEGNFQVRIKSVKLCESLNDSIGFTNNVLYRLEQYSNQIKKADQKDKLLKKYSDNMKEGETK